MKALFLNPPFKVEYGKFSRTSRSPAITKSGTVYYPIWLCYAAAATEQAGHTITVIDSCADRLPLDETLARVDAFNPGLVVLDTSTPSIVADIKTAAAIKARHPGTLVVMMGTHPSSLPEETLAAGPAVDAIIRNEADATVRDLANRLHERPLSSMNADERRAFLADVPGIVFRSGDEFVRTAARPLIGDLDALPFVTKIYKEHLNIRNYFFAACDFPEVQIMSARGCTDRCTFCVYPYAMHELRYRMRSASNLADEFDFITRELPEVKEVGIEDDTFAGSVKRVREFCEEKIRRGNALKWYTNVRATLDLDTMELMRRANCVLLTVGYESANQDVLDLMKKRMKSQSIVDFSRNARQAGLMVHSCFMVGNRGDTRASLQQSLDLALQLNDDTMQFFPLIVYPGTPDFEWARVNKLLTVKSYDEWVTPEGLHNSVVRMPDMSCREIVDWCDYARRRYYLRPRYLAYKLWQSVSRPSELFRNVKAAKRFVHFLMGGTFGGSPKARLRQA